MIEITEDLMRESEMLPLKDYQPSLIFSLFFSVLLLARISLVMILINIHEVLQLQ